MSWFVVGGIAIGATAGAIHGSQKGGDDVWKDALMGGAIGGAAGFAAAPAAAAAAPAAAAPAAAGGGAGIMGASAAPAAVGGAGTIAGGAGTAGGVSGLYGSGAALGSSVVPSAYGAAGSGLAAGTSAGIPTVASGGAGMMGGATGAAGFAGAPQAIPMVSNSMGFSGTPTSFAGSGSSFGSTGGASAPSGGGILNAPSQSMSMVEAPVTDMSAWGTPPAQSEPIALKPGESLNDGLLRLRDAGNKDITGGAATKSPLQSGFDSALSWLSEPKNAMLAGTLGLGALSMLTGDGQDDFDEPDVQQAGYPLSPNFKPSRYQPTRRYAMGGIADVGMQNPMPPQSQIPDRMQFSTPTQMPASMEVLRSDYDTRVNPYTGEPVGFAEGGKTKRNLAMLDTKAGAASQAPAPGFVGSPGIYRDDDEDTKYQDALSAAQTRMGKAAKNANVKFGVMQKPTPLGRVNLDPTAGVQEKASGGIASLGSYAAGGNPRLLKGPGDGMSDDIPATIGGSQPARLADGEFVVPADVVSGLGNGSTEAGAKKLHQMMDKVRMDRTGTKKQGKEIDGDAYIPGGKTKAKKKAAGGIAGYADGGNVDYSQYYVYDAMGNQVPMSTLLNATQQQIAPSPTANTTAQGYNPDYYNPMYYQSQLDAANQAMQQAQATLARPTSYGNAIGMEGQTVNLQPGTQVVYGADGRYSAPVTVGESGMLDLSNTVFGDPLVGTKKQAYLYDPNIASAADIDAANKMLAEQQAAAATAQQNLGRLQNTQTAYTPYTVANRPSAADPQFYGNIYQERYADYAQPGYDMNAQLGVWNNEYGGNREATGRQQNIATLGVEQRAAGDAAFQQAQQAAQQAMKPKEEKKRKGGILAAKK